MVSGVGAVEWQLSYSYPNEELIGVTRKNLTDPQILLE
jgi:hypothetical protein